MSADRNPPETPEAVAFELMRLIHDAEEKDGRRNNRTSRAELLDLYAICLVAARGDRRPALH